MILMKVLVSKVREGSQIFVDKWTFVNCVTNLQWEQRNNSFKGTLGESLFNKGYSEKNYRHVYFHGFIQRSF